MPFDPSYLVLSFLQWVREKILGYLKPLRVDYDESILKIELLPWMHMPAMLGALLLVIALVCAFEGSWTAMIVVVFFGGGATALASWALRNIRTIILANKPQQWIRVTEHGIFRTKSRVIKVKNLKAITYELVSTPGVIEDPYGRDWTRTFTVSVMTGEGSTNILEGNGEDDASAIVGYLNAFFFDEDETEDGVKQTL